MVRRPRHRWGRAHNGRGCRDGIHGVLWTCDGDQYAREPPSAVVDARSRRVHVAPGWGSPLGNCGLTPIRWAVTRNSWYLYSLSFFVKRSTAIQSLVNPANSLMPGGLHQSSRRIQSLSHLSLPVLRALAGGRILRCLRGAGR